MCDIFVPDSAYQRFQRRDGQRTEMQAYCTELCIKAAHPRPVSPAPSRTLLRYPVCVRAPDGAQRQGSADLRMAFRRRCGTVTLSAHAPASAGKRCSILVIDPHVRPRLAECVGGIGMFVPDLLTTLLASMRRKRGYEIARLLSGLPDAEGVLDAAGTFSRTFPVTLPGRLPGRLLAPRAAYPPSDTWLLLVIE